MARRAPRRFVRPPPRTKMWIQAGVGRTTIVGGAKTLISILNATGLALRPFTVLRTRMLLALTTDQEAADEGPFGVYGHIIVSDTAAAVGVTAIPDPSQLVNPDASWYVYEPLQTQFVTTAGGAAFLTSPNHRMIDSKAMRKVGADDQLCALYTDEAGVGSFLTDIGRTLIQLH